MKNKSLIGKLSFFYFYLSCFVVAVVALLPWWPKNDLLIIPKYLLLFGPRWWLFFVVIPLFFVWRWLNKSQKMVLPLLLVAAINYNDFQLPDLSAVVANNIVGVNEFKVISYNIGGGGSVDELKLLVKYYQPDVLLLQEARKLGLKRNFGKQYQSACDSGLCILSKFPFKRIQGLSRGLFGGWGNFAVFYQIYSPYGEISLANVHLETPRSVLMSVIHRAPDQKQAQKTESSRQLQVDLLSAWVEGKPFSLVIGDFNMPADENLFQANFGHLNNAVGIKGLGFYHTKLTSWYGARIDHILYSDNFHLAEVEVIELLKGDHRPLMAKFQIVK